jgi:hypothetical protein
MSAAVPKSSVLVINGTGHSLPAVSNAAACSKSYVIPYWDGQVPENGTVCGPSENPFAVNNELVEALRSSAVSLLLGGDARGLWNAAIVATVMLGLCWSSL